MEEDWFLKLHKRPYNSLVFDHSILICVKIKDGRYGFVFRKEMGISFCHLFEVIPGPPSINAPYLRGMVQLQLNVGVVIRVKEELIEKQILVLHADCFESGNVFYLNGADDICYIQSIRRDLEVLLH